MHELSYALLLYMIISPWEWLKKPDCHSRPDELHRDYRESSVQILQISGFPIEAFGNDKGLFDFFVNPIKG